MTRSAINAVALAVVYFFGLSMPVPAHAESMILALGDSLVAGYGLQKADSFATKLESALQAAGRSVRVVDAGGSGDTSKGGLARNDWLFAEKPDLMLLELGANDGLRGLPPADTKRNLAAIIEKARAADVPVLLTGIQAPPNLGRVYADEFNAVFPNLAEQYGVHFYPFFLDGVAANASLNQDDGIHPNAAGVEVIVERILPTVLRALDAISGS